MINYEQNFQFVNKKNIKYENIIVFKFLSFIFITLFVKSNFLLIIKIEHFLWHSKRRFSLPFLSFSLVKLSSLIQQIKITSTKTINLSSKLFNQYPKLSRNHKLVRSCMDWGEQPNNIYLHILTYRTALLPLHWLNLVISISLLKWVQ